MADKRVRHASDFKAIVAIEAVKGQEDPERTGVIVGSPFQSDLRWKKQATDGMAALFSLSLARKDRAEEELRSRLYQEIGQLKVDVDWLKKCLLS